uniref:F-box domain-containing protein n=1 Tax=viral metagenome TaxID=1070528 RepID=A0A6C0C8Z9_9ZZZZ
MNTSCDDIILSISIHLTDYDKINLTTTSKRIYNTRNNMLFYQRININRISSLPYFNNFTNVIIFDGTDPIPLRATHLSFDDRFDKSIKGIIPHSVTHLALGNLFDQRINDGDIPNSVTCLEFGAIFMEGGQDLKVVIPPSVKILKLNGFIYKHIDEIPSSVNCLVFHQYFYRPIDHVPNNIKRIIVSDNYEGLIDNKILSNVDVVVCKHKKLWSAFGYL